MIGGIIMRLYHRLPFFLSAAVMGAATVFGLTGCAQNADAAQNKAAADDTEKPVIICTLFPQYDFARQIYGDEAEVKMLLSPGQESHMYDPTPKDMMAIADADMFIYTGDEMEPWAAEIVESLEDVYVLDLSQYVDLESEEAHEEASVEFVTSDDTQGDDDTEHDADTGHDADDEHTGDEEEHESDGHTAHAHDHESHHHEHSYDPHYWLNLENAAKMTEAIAKASENVDVSDRQALRARAENYESELMALDEDYHTMIEGSSRNDLVFAGRFAYGYLISHYGLIYESVYASCSAEADPSIADMTRVIDYIESEDVNTLFYEELSSGRVAQTVAEDTDVKTCVLSTAHNVSKEEFESGITFLDIMRQNYEVIREALN